MGELKAVGFVGAMLMCMAAFAFFEWRSNRR